MIPLASGGRIEADAGDEPILNAGRTYGFQSF